MTSAFDRAVSAGLATVRSAAGVSVTYTPLSGSAVTVTAVKAERVWTSELADGVIFSEKVTDWLIAVADLSAVPVRGDTINATINGTARVFRVIAADGSTHPFEFSDHNETTYRIHTKQIQA